MDGWMEMEIRRKPAEYQVFPSSTHEYHRHRDSRQSVDQIRVVVVLWYVLTITQFLLLVAWRCLWGGDYFSGVKPTGYCMQACIREGGKVV